MSIVLFTFHKCYLIKVRLNTCQGKKLEYNIRNNAKKEITVTPPHSTYPTL